MTANLRTGETRRPYRVLMTCGVFEPGFRGGGPVRSVAGILDTAPADIEVILVTSDRDLGRPEPYPGLSGRWRVRGRARVFYLDAAAPRAWWRLWRELHHTTFDLLYVNSLWSPYFTAVPVLAVRLGLLRVRDVLVAPRGELAPGALGIKARKKRALLRGWVAVLSGVNARWHASTPGEAADIRAAHRDADVTISRNPVSLPPGPLPPVVHDGAVRLVYIGRVVEVKNVILILEAMLTLTQPVVFDIYGPREDPAYWTRCASLLAQLPGHVQARYRGELAPAAVRETFAGYDRFVLPTRGENFGHVIAESLSASCPVVCSDRTAWTPTLRAGGGHILDKLSPESLAEHLSSVVAMTPVEHLHARLRAGDAYRRWRAESDARNILDLARSHR